MKPHLHPLPVRHRLAALSLAALINLIGAAGIEALAGPDSSALAPATSAA